MQSIAVVAELRTLLKREMIVPVVGAGVSIATAHVPGWEALLKNGVVHLRARGLLTPIVETTLKKTLETNQLTKAATILQKEMGAPGGEYAAWLQHEFDDRNWTISDSQLITEILDLPCPLIATTNYDLLLERFDANLRRTTFHTELAGMVTALRHGGIFHLHGIYTEPASVILSDNDYSTVTDNPAYRSAVQALWMTKSLLFIGCSFDGITDPDFRKLFEWASNTFGPAPHRHYALVLDEVASVENNRHYLLSDFRLQPVPFGRQPNELAKFVATINPSRPEARLRRANRVNELLASPDAIDVSSFLNALGPWMPPAKITEFEFEARIALGRRIERVERNRATITVAKAILENLPEKDDIIALHSRWQRESVYSDNVHQTCLAALTAISTVPRDFFRELNKLDCVLIPASVVEGMSQSQVMSLEQLPTAAARASAMSGDRYGFELIGRLLRTFKIILQLDSDAIFPLPSESERVSLRGTFIAVGSSTGVTLVDVVSLSAVAFIKTDNRVRDLMEIEYKGAKALIVLMGDRWLIWDPRRSGLPLADISLLSDGIATNILPDPSLKPGAFGVKVSEDRVFHFLATSHIHTTAIPSIESFAAVDGRLYGCVNAGEVFQLSTDGSISCVIRRDEILRRVQSLLKPVIAKKRASIASTQHAFLQAARVNGRDVLAICVRFDVAKDGNTAVLLWQRDSGFVGSWFFEGRIGALDIVMDGAGACLVATLLTHRCPDEPLMLWASPDNDQEPLQFRIIQSGVRIEEDIFCLRAIDKTKWFASDLTGRSYLVSKDAAVTPLSVDVGTNPYASAMLNW